MRISDWSSDVCSSDLENEELRRMLHSVLRSIEQKTHMKTLQDLEARVSALVAGTGVTGTGATAPATPALQVPEVEVAAEMAFAAPAEAPAAAADGVAAAAAGRGRTGRGSVGGDGGY